MRLYSTYGQNNCKYFLQAAQQTLKMYKTRTAAIKNGTTPAPVNGIKQVV